MIQRVKIIQNGPSKSHSRPPRRWFNFFSHRVVFLLHTSGEKYIVIHGRRWRNRYHCWVPAVTTKTAQNPFDQSGGTQNEEDETHTRLSNLVFRFSDGGSAKIFICAPWQLNRCPSNIDRVGVDGLLLLCGAGFAILSRVSNFLSTPVVPDSMSDLINDRISRWIWFVPFWINVSHLIDDTSPNYEWNFFTHFFIQ